MIGPLLFVSVCFFSADYDNIIHHVLTTMRQDLHTHRFVDEPRLESATVSLADRLIQDRNQYVKAAVADALKQVYSKIDQTITEENAEDRATLADARQSILTIVDQRIRSALDEWSNTLIQRFTRELSAETDARHDSLQSLLGELTKLRDSDLASASSARTSLRTDVLNEFQALLAAEQTEDAQVASAFEAKIAQLFADENAEDAETLKSHLLATRTEFEQLLTSRLDSRLTEFESSLRKKLMSEAANAFAPISAVLNQAADSSQLQEDILLQRLKSHLESRVADIELPKPKEVDTAALEERLQTRMESLVNAIELPQPKDPKEPKEPREPREIDEAALESRITDRLTSSLDSSARVVELQARLDSLESNVESVRALATEADAVARARPVTGETPTPKDWSSEIQQLTTAIENIRSQQTPAIDHSNELAALTQRLQQLSQRIQALEERPVEVAGVDHSEELETIRQAVARLSNVEPTRSVDYQPTLDYLNQQIGELRGQLEQAQSDVASHRAELESLIASKVASMAPSASSTSTPTTAPVDVDVIRREIALALERFSADRTQLVDYALRTSGGRVLSHSPSHQVPLEGNWLTSMVKRCFMTVRKPDELLNDNMSVGNCWPMDGSKGYVTIGLRERITPTSVSIQHSAVTPDHTTAPKEFSVYVSKERRRVESNLSEAVDTIFISLFVFSHFVCYD